MTGGNATVPNLLQDASWDRDRTTINMSNTNDQALLLDGGERGDDRLDCLRVESVQPAPDSSRLLVTLVADCALKDFDREAIDRQLQAAAGRLRTAVAEAITRRKAPSLVFAVLAPVEAGHVREKGARHEES